MSPLNHDCLAQGLIAGPGRVIEQTPEKLPALPYIDIARSHSVANAAPLFSPENLCTPFLLFTCFTGNMSHASGFSFFWQFSQWSETEV
jgi:hypothetical protein